MIEGAVSPWTHALANIPYVIPRVNEYSVEILINRDTLNRAAFGFKGVI